MRNPILLLVVTACVVSTTGAAIPQTAATTPRGERHDNVQTLHARVTKLEETVRELQREIAKLRPVPPNIQGRWNIDTKPEFMTLIFRDQNRFEIEVRTPDGLQHATGSWNRDERNGILVSYKYTHDKSTSAPTKSTFRFVGNSTIESGGMQYHREDEQPDNVANAARRIEVSQLTPEFDGTEVVIRFKVEKTIWLSGTVPAGQSRSFVIETGRQERDPRFSVLVIGEIADAMERFGYAPPQQDDPARGLVIEARGKIKVHPAPKSAPEKGLGYEFRIADLSGFRITSSGGITKR